MKLAELKSLAPRSRSLSRLATVAVSCGEPLEISNEIELFDFNELLTGGRDGVYFIRAVGDSMEMEIKSGDMLIVNRNLQASDGDKIVASLNGNFTVKIFRASPTLQLVATNGKYTPRKISRRDDFQIFGVITHVIHSLKKI